MEHSLIFLIFIIVPLLLFLYYNRRLKRQILQKILERNLLRGHAKNLWYSSQPVWLAAKALGRLSRKDLQPRLAYLRDGNIGTLRPLVDKQTWNEIRIIGGTPARVNKLARAEIALIDADMARFAKLVAGIKPQNSTEQARLVYLQAAQALFDGDLQTAADLAADAIRRFRKLDFVYEEAQAYLLSGSIYRVSAVTDTAEFMLRTAAQLFASINAAAKQAEVMANLGMLMVMQERFDEAEEYFENAQKLFAAAQDENGQAEIINQQALTALIRADYTKAIKLAAQARSIFEKRRNFRGNALSLDIAAQAAAAQNNWKKAESQAKMAQRFYQKTKNLPAEQEMTLLRARALLEKGQTEAAEKKLRKIINQKQPSCFHVANAYNLLGIIYLQQGDLRRAEGLFQQSLSAEVQNERWAGAAVDCANIALTAYRRGHKENGDKNRKLALQYAKEAGAENLVKMLEQKLF